MISHWPFTTVRAHRVWPFNTGLHEAANPQGEIVVALGATARGYKIGAFKKSKRFDLTLMALRGFPRGFLSTHLCRFGLFWCGLAQTCAFWEGSTALPVRSAPPPGVRWRLSGQSLAHYWELKWLNLS